MKERRSGCASRRRLSVHSECQGKMTRSTPTVAQRNTKSRTPSRYAQSFNPPLKWLMAGGLSAKTVSAVDGVPSSRVFEWLSLRGVLESEITPRSHSWLTDRKSVV